MFITNFISLVSVNSLKNYRNIVVKTCFITATE